MLLAYAPTVQVLHRSFNLVLYPAKPRHTSLSSLSVLPRIRARQSQISPGTNTPINTSKPACEVDSRHCVLRKALPRAQLRVGADSQGAFPRFTRLPVGRRLVRPFFSSGPRLSSARRLQQCGAHWIRTSGEFYPQLTVDLVLRHRHLGADTRYSSFGNVSPLQQGLVCPSFRNTDHVHPFSYIFANFQVKEVPNNAPPSKTVPTFLALYSFGFIYELVLVWDALRLKNTIQVIGLCLCNVGLLIYGAVQVQQIRTSINTLAENDKIDSVVWSQSEPFLIIIPCIVALGTLLMSFVAWKLYDEFAWTIYKHISADLRMKRRYLTYQVQIFPRPL